MHRSRTGDNWETGQLTGDGHPGVEGAAGSGRTAGRSLAAGGPGIAHRPGGVEPAAGHGGGGRGRSQRGGRVPGGHLVGRFEAVLLFGETTLAFEHGSAGLRGAGIVQLARSVHIVAGRVGGSG